MKIVLAPDSFKGSLTAREVCQAMAEGIRRVIPEAELVMAPVADGGEGTVRALVDATGGRIIEQKVTGPLGAKVTAFLGILGDGKTAALEMASASGLMLVHESKRNPMITTSFGTGELMLAAINHGCSKIIMGIGGSATNDGGTGMAKAFGYRFLDQQGRELQSGGGWLQDLARIEVSNLEPRLKEVEIIAACDVTNPLTGPMGASVVYGPQKGATPAMVQELDQALGNLATVIQQDLGVSVADLPGAGAAGGMGAGLVAFTGAKLRRGVEIVLETVKFSERLKDADLVITGEGSLDGQTIHGKTPCGVARAAKVYGLKVLAVAGQLGKGWEMVFDQGIDGVIPIVEGPITLAEAVSQANQLVTGATERILRIFLTGYFRGKQEKGLSPF